LTLLALDRAGDLAHQPGHQIDRIIEREDAGERAARVHHRYATDTGQPHPLQHVVQLVVLVRDQRLLRHHIAHCHSVRVDVARQHREHQVTVREHSDRLLQLVTITIDDEKTHVPLPH
jgi:hypothetical protein